MVAFPEYNDFFSKATGNSPYCYQAELANADDWPLALSVGTGLGKTAATVLAWLWRRRFADEETRLRTPRRLIYCLPQRTLVYQTVQSIRQWLLRLELDSEACYGAALCDELVNFQLSPVANSTLPVYVLQGGETSSDWDIYPEQDAIIVGTQDQLLSRALNRGYSMSRFRWPMHYALLNSDCLWIIDEPQLFGVDALATTAQMQAFRQSFGTFGNAITIWVSATFRMEWLRTVDFSEFSRSGKRLGLGDADFESVRYRREAPKPLSFAPLSLSKESAVQKGSFAYALELAELTLSRHRSGTVTLVICNRVSRAQAVYRALRKLGKAEENTMLLHSRFRNVDRGRMNQGLNSLRDRDYIVVATQAVEAGVDISAETLITELAPWASLVQRFGRCNRDGLAKVPSVIVVDVELESDTCIPYEVDDLVAAKEKLNGIQDARISDLPEVEDKMIAHHVIRRRDVLNLFDTTPDLAGLDIDISPYVRSGNNLDVEVFWRSWDGEKPGDVKSKPSSNEVCHVSMSMFRDYLGKSQKGQRRMAWTWNILSEKWDPLVKETVYPGQTILLDARHGGYTTEVGFAADEWSNVPIYQEAIEPSLSLDGHDRENDNMRRPDTLPVTLLEHAGGVVRHAVKLSEQFNCVQGFEYVVEAAKYHDWGKLHPVFQEKMKRHLPQESLWLNQYLAKGGDAVGIGYLRRGFRHELASALAYLQIQPIGLRNDLEKRLVAYLIAAHHGKVRLSIRSIPTEQGPTESDSFHGRQGFLFARGVWDGDNLPEFTLCDGTVFPQVSLSLELLQMGSLTTGEESDPIESWSSGALACLEHWGPFRLAWYETILRVADWRASAEEVNHAE